MIVREVKICRLIDRPSHWERIEHPGDAFQIPWLKERGANQIWNLDVGDYYYILNGYNILLAIVFEE